MYFLPPLINYTTVTLEKMTASPSRFTVWCAHIRRKPSSPTTGSITCTAKQSCLHTSMPRCPSHETNWSGVKSCLSKLAILFQRLTVDKIKCIGCFWKDGFEDCNKFLATLLVSQHHFLVLQDHSLKPQDCFLPSPQT